MLEALASFAADHSVYRFANLVDFRDMLREMDLAVEDIDEVLEFLGAAAVPSDAEQLLDAPFAAKPQLDVRKVTPTRFSDGSQRVFYSALEPETAASEVVYWYAGAALGPSARVAYYNRLRCRFRGSAFDLRPLVGNWPFLIGDGEGSYAQCQALASEGLKLGIDGFFTPSARRPSGTNVPVFKREALTEPTILGVTALSRDPRTGQTIVRDR